MRYQFRRGLAMGLGLVAALLFTVPALAENEGWYIIGSGYHTQLEESENDDFREEQTGTPLFPMTSVVERRYDAGYASDENFGLSIGHDYRGPFRFDIELRSFENDIDRREFESGPNNLGRETVDTRSLAFNFWYDFNHLGAFRPYLGLGVGYADLELRGGADDEIPFGQAGVGVNWFFTDRLALDVGYRYFLGDDPDFERSNRLVKSEYEGQSYTVGLRFNFFSGAGEIGDSDGDGVNDRADRCPGTPRNASVDRDGCAVDGDNDGVADYLDECPNTPPGTEVNNIGCEISNDTDNDGVVNAKDQCPGTPPGEPVLSTGCSASQSQVLEGVNFELNSATLTREAREQCREVARLMAGSKGFDVEVQGHTDNQGDKAYNQRLSQERAESFKQCLVTEGVDEARLTAAGYGEAQPIADNDTASGRARNRRVELEVIE